MKVTSLAVQLLPGESGDWRLPTHRELVIVASAAPARRSPRPRRTRGEPLRLERAIRSDLSKTGRASGGTKLRRNPSDRSTPGGLAAGPVSAALSSSSLFPCASPGGE